MRDQTDSRTLPIFPVGDYTPGARPSRGYDVLLCRYARDMAPTKQARARFERELRDLARQCIGAGVA